MIRKYVMVPEDIRNRVIEIIGKYDEKEKHITMNVLKKNIYGIYLVGNEFDEYNATNVKSVAEFNRLFDEAVEEVRNAPASSCGGGFSKAKGIRELGKLPAI